MYFVTGVWQHKLSFFISVNINWHSYFVKGLHKNTILQLIDIKIHVEKEKHYRQGSQR